MHSHCTSSEGPRSEPWLGAPSWPTCSPGLRSKCPAPALLSVSPLASQLRSNPKETFTERLSFARQSNLRWFTDASLRAGGLPSGFKAHLTGPLCRGPAPNVWLRPFPRGRGLRGPCSCAATGPLFYSLAAEEPGLEDPPDSGWRLCLRLHGPLHPEGLSPDGHELPFLFEQVRISGIHASPNHPPLTESLPFWASAFRRQPRGRLCSNPRPPIPNPEASSRRYPAAPTLTPAAPPPPRRLTLCCCAAGRPRPTTRCAPWRRCACRACTGTSPHGRRYRAWTACCPPQPRRVKTLPAPSPGLPPPPPCWPGQSGARAWPRGGRSGPGVAGPAARREAWPAREEVAPARRRLCWEAGSGYGAWAELRPWLPTWLLRRSVQGSALLGMTFWS